MLKFMWVKIEDGFEIQFGIKTKGGKVDPRGRNKVENVLDDEVVGIDNSFRTLVCDYYGMKATRISTDYKQIDMMKKTRSQTLNTRSELSSNLS